MKKITKSVEPPEFTEWKLDDKMDHRPRWNRVDFETRRVIHESLMREQGFICCYCESRITKEDSHVEHFCPRDLCRDLQLDYSNLLCSCVRKQSPGEPDHCGHHKGSWFDKDALISPLQEGCETRFRFTANGEIRPRSSSDVAAVTTIEKLALDLPKLNALRAAAVDALRDLPAPDVERVLVRGQDDRFLEYFATIKDVLL